MAPPALYLSLEEAAVQLKLRDSPPTAKACRPAPTAAQAEEDPAMTSALQAAELLHCVREVLLPRMREPNAAVACGAVAALYELLVVAPSCLSQPFLATAAACPTAASAPCPIDSFTAPSQQAVCRLMLSESTLVKQVKLLRPTGACLPRLLLRPPASHGFPLLPCPPLPPPQVLSLLQLDHDCALITTCLCFLELLSSEPSCRQVLMEGRWVERVTILLRSPDGVVRIMAERALCSMHAHLASAAAI